jgi:hypothetical protein
LEICAERWSVIEFLNHFFGKLVKQVHIFSLFLEVVALVADLVAGDLIVLFHGVDHLPVYRGQLDFTQVLVFTQIQVFQVTFKHHPHILFLHIFRVAVVGQPHN